MGPLIVIAIILLIILIAIISNVKIVPQAHAYVVERLGAYHSTWGTGLHVKIPFIDKVSRKVSLKEQVVDFPPQPVITRDNVTMQIDTVVYFEITDPKLYSYGVERPLNAIENLTATTLRNIIGELELDSTLTSRDTINDKIRIILDEATDAWGIRVKRVELKNILPPREIQDAMEKQMKAERERRAKILDAEGEKRSQILIAEGLKESAILKADAVKEQKIREAAGEAEAILTVQRANADALRMLNEAAPTDRIIQLKSLEAFAKAADGKATKIIIPSEIQGIAGLTIWHKGAVFICTLRCFFIGSELMVLILWTFVIFSFLGWVGNVIRNLAVYKRFKNNGFLTSPFFPMYGLTAVICRVVLTPLANYPWLLLAASIALTTAVIVLSGFLFEKILGFKVWDYSQSKLSIGSYISLPYALLAGLFGFGFIKVFMPVSDALVMLIPTTVSYIILFALLAIILLDYIFSVITVIRLKRRIKYLSNIEELLGDDADEEKIKLIGENCNRLFTENILRRRLANAFPDLKTSVYLGMISDKVGEVKDKNMTEYTAVFENKEERPFAFGLCFTKLFYLFVIGSLFGTILETLWAFMIDGNFQVRVGLVYGPFIPVYGGGACFLTVVLYKLYKLNDTLIFVISAVVGASFEYFCSWFQETVFGTVSWDYSDTPLNFNGRTNLMYALIWGFLGLVWVRFVYPWMARLIEKIPKRAGGVMTAVLIIFMVFNAFMSCAAVYRWQDRAEHPKTDNAFIQYIDYHFDDEKMEFLFPNMKAPEKD